MIRRPPRSTLSSSSAASDVYKRQASSCACTSIMICPSSPACSNEKIGGKYSSNCTSQHCHVSKRPLLEIANLQLFYPSMFNSLTAIHFFHRTFVLLLGYYSHFPHILP